MRFAVISIIAATAIAAPVKRDDGFTTDVSNNLITVLTPLFDETGKAISTTVSGLMLLDQQTTNTDSAHSSRRSSRVYQATLWMPRTRRSMSSRLPSPTLPMPPPSSSSALPRMARSPPQQSSSSPVSRLMWTRWLPASTTSSRSGASLLRTRTTSSTTFKPALRTSQMLSRPSSSVAS